MTINNNQTTNNQSSSQTENVQSIFAGLIKYSHKISSITAEILKIISIFSIIFIVLGFLDILFYTENQKIQLPLSRPFKISCQSELYKIYRKSIKLKKILYFFFTILFILAVFFIHYRYFV